MRASPRFCFLLRRQQWSPFTLEPVEFAELNFDFHPRAVRSWLKECNFSVQRQLTVSHFRMGLFKRLLPLELLVKMDALAQWTGDWWQLTPSVFVKAQAIGDTPVAAPDAFFRCPECGGNELEEGLNVLVCRVCQRQWGFRNGIYDFRQPLSK